MSSLRRTASEPGGEQVYLSFYKKGVHREEVSPDAPTEEIVRPTQVAASGEEVGLRKTKERKEVSDEAFLNALVSFARDFYSFEPGSGQTEADFFLRNRENQRRARNLVQTIAGYHEIRFDAGVLSEELSGRCPNIGRFIGLCRMELSRDLQKRFDEMTRD